jgi:thiol-disulfide isomerase/thioredoxin
MIIDLSGLKDGFSSRLRVISFFLAIIKIRKLKKKLLIYEKKTKECPFLFADFCKVKGFKIFKLRKKPKNSIRFNSYNLDALKTLKKNYDIKFNNKPNLSLYFATWCGHCNTFKPIWEQIKNDQNNLQFCDFYTIDCSGDKPETSINKSPNGTDIDGFPTIILSINNKDIIYQGSRTKKEIENFIKKQIL